MRVVVDTNVTATLSQNSRFRQLLYNKNFDFYAPQILHDEIYEHIDKILKYSKQSPNQTLKYLNDILSIINYYHLELIPKETYDYAYILCKNYDAEDTPFIA